MTATVPSERSSRISVLSAPTWKTRILALTASSRRSLRTGAWRAVLLALAAAHDAQRAQQLVVDRLRDARAVGDERHGPQDHRHEQEDADVVDAGLAAIRRSWRALWGHPGTLATIA